jgi:HlyD family secretion protein
MRLGVAAVKRAVIFVVLVVPVTALALYWMWSARPVAEVFVAERGTAVATVYGTVKVVASMQMNLRARCSGVIEFDGEIAGPGAVGREVRRGQVLARIATPDLDRELAKAEADLNAALARQQSGPGSAAALRTQEAQLARLQKLAETGNAAASEVERVRNEVEALRERVRLEQVELDRLVAVLREQLGVLGDRKARCTMRSPLEGLLTAVNAVDGEFIGENSIPFVVATKSTFLEGRVNEEDVGWVKPKMKASVRLYAYAGQEFSATVSQVLPQAENQQYTVTLTLEEPPETLRAGMTGEMNIVTGRRENAVLIPARALLSDRVLVVSGGVVKPRAVRVGFRNIERAEILEGLEEGEMVIVADQESLRPGARVRPVTVNR